MTDKMDEAVPVYLVEFSTTERKEQVQRFIRGMTRQEAYDFDLEDEIIEPGDPMWHDAFESVTVGDEIVLD